VLQDDSQTHTLRARAAAQPALGVRVETIKVTTLDTFVETHRLSMIDLLKIDTEGHEMAVLSGALALLEHQRIGLIFLEASLDPADAVHTSLPVAATFLRRFGFQLAAIYDQVIWRNPVRLAYVNALFVPSFSQPCSMTAPTWSDRH
jgi:hypothetical protein